MKYRIYFDEEEVINGIKDFDTVKELLDFIGKMSWGVIHANSYRYSNTASEVYENDNFRINYISEIEEKIITLEEPIKVAIEIGRKKAEEEAKILDEQNKKCLEDRERTKFEELKKKFGN